VFFRFIGEKVVKIISQTLGSYQERHSTGFSRIKKVNLGFKSYRQKFLQDALFHDMAWA
jgi:hypothetical protein